MEFGSEFYWFILIGIGAQLVDGALGMAFGLVSSSVLLAMGLPPAAVSASIHTAEVFTTGASGVSHLVAGNVDKRLFLRLALPGAVGGAHCVAVHLRVVAARHVQGRADVGGQHPPAGGGGVDGVDALDRHGLREQRSQRVSERQQCLLHGHGPGDR